MKSAFEPCEASWPQVAQHCFLLNLSLHPKICQVRDGGTNFILRIKEQETSLILHEHDDDDPKI
jgi:hypothetical protein